ncbi:MAG: transposase, partial [Flavobacteriales bacterium]
MSKYNPDFHNRKSIRLEGYDYSSQGAYFITLCCRNREHLFGEIINGSMELNQLGKIIEEEWMKTIEIRSHISLGEWIVMPNHFHGIIHIEKDLGQNPEHIGKFRSPSQTIGAIIRGFKGATTKRIKKLIFDRPDRPDRP